MSSSETRYPRMLSRRSFIGAAVAATGLGASIALPARSRGLFYPGAIVGGVDLTDMTREQGEATLRASFASLERHAVTYAFDTREWALGLAELGISIDYAAMLDAAWALGRDDGLVGRYAVLLDQAPDWHAPVAIIRDDTVLDTVFAGIAAEIDTPVRNARLIRRGGEIDVLPDVTGARLDTQAALADTVASVTAGKTARLGLRTVPVPPDVTAADLEGAKDDAIVLIGSPVTVTEGDRTWEIGTEQLTAALVIPKGGMASIDPARLGVPLNQIAEETYVAPVNAVLGWGDGGLQAVQNDIPGSEVDRATLESQVVTATTTVDARSVSLPMTPVPAEVRADNLAELGIVGLIASGSSSFAGSSAVRAENVKAAARNISAALVRPGENLSFNDALGPISLENGYVEGKIIQGDWTASDLGGGVCQVSTTVFRAAFYAGFRFEEWNPHSWRLAFYEADGSPPGLDAAIYQPNTPEEWELDLVFTNPFDAWMLLQMVVDGETVTAQLYGASSPYTVEVGAPVIGPPVEPGPPVTKVKPELPPGTRNKVNTPSPGYTVQVSRRVLEAGVVISDFPFESIYQPQPEVWEVGPGTPGTPTSPAGAPPEG